ncbi:msr8616 [Mesorhizobium japonicum MAFF 303099]|uniref:Msr8616 protein n=1 Tax=Mesorhizobium japonicum (strain LMG 29417 / CECT 9101 / MAFF 303099) TaxID=266835 RepID=Q98IY1_RHILO|nr:msr8616 [Mesorhizobium japonicum MAFF 303099]
MSAGWSRKAPASPSCRRVRRRSPRTLRSLRLSDDWATRQLNLCARSFDELTPQAKLLAAALAGAETGGLPGRYQGNGPSS